MITKRSLIIALFSIMVVCFSFIMNRLYKEQIMNKEQVRVGIGVVIVNEENKVLIGKRINSFAPFYSIPGGHIELGETFENAATREIQEETGLIIREPQVIAVTNNLETFKKENKHYVSVVLLAKNYEGNLENKEPHKCEGWHWIDPNDIPHPHFDASEQAINCFVNSKFYNY